MFISPMLLETAIEPFYSEEYIFELKCNGVRLLLQRKNGKNIMYTRHGTELTGRFP